MHPDKHIKVTGGLFVEYSAQLGYQDMTQKWSINYIAHIRGITSAKGFQGG